MKLMHDPNDGPMNIAILMSNVGVKAESMLNYYLEQNNPSFIPSLIFTDNPKSNAKKIVEKYSGKITGLSYEQKIIKDDTDFEDVASMFMDHHIDLVVLAGFYKSVPLSICGGYMAINVSPGRLKGKDDVERDQLYSGHGWVSVAKAILFGAQSVCSTVHVMNGKPDGGKNLAISEGVRVPQERYAQNYRLWLGEFKSLEDAEKEVNRMKMDNALRTDITSKIPIYGYASDLHGALKMEGDCVILPKTIDLIAQGRFGYQGPLKHDASAYFFDGKQMLKPLTLTHNGIIKFNS